MPQRRITSLPTKYEIAVAQAEDRAFNEPMHEVPHNRITNIAYIRQWAEPDNGLPTIPGSLHDEEELCAARENLQCLWMQTHANSAEVSSVYIMHDWLGRRAFIE